MKVITANPVIEMKMSRIKQVCDDFSSFDSTNSSQVKAFQDWLDIKHPNWLNGKKLNKGSGYGTFGPSTQAAAKLYATEFDAGASDLLNIFNSMGSSSGSNAPSVVPPNATITDPMGNTKSGHFWDKAKGIFIKAKDAGVIDAIKNRINQKTNGSSSTSSSSYPDTGSGGYDTSISSEPTKSNKTKIILMVAGGVVILGAIIYFVMRKNK